MSLSNKELISKLRNEVNNKFCIVDDNAKNIKKINHILIIDDDDISNYVTRKTLECYNIVNKISVFDDPTKALEFLKQSKSQPDIILLDIKMPVMDGFQFIDEFNKLNSKSSIVILSSSVYSKDKDKAKDEGVKYMTKPLKVKTFQKIIE